MVWILYVSVAISYNYFYLAYSFYCNYYRNWRFSCRIFSDAALSYCVFRMLYVSGMEES
jgi:hypothetical protein